MFSVLTAQFIGGSYLTGPGYWPIVRPFIKRDSCVKFTQGISLFITIIPTLHHLTHKEAAHA